ncbi:putative hydrolase YcgS like protein [Verticillium longisporum]|nr:putative hydrolase YcgS like protein [Verticillium longisporum]
MASYLESIFFRTRRQTSLTGGLASERSLVPERDTSETLTLPDGRRLGFAQYGLLTGKPVFYCHGLPGSRVEAGHLHEEAVANGVRIIATDRPGMGLSSPQPERTLIDHPKDLELLADHLKLSEYGVLGVSGGGPYALACAVSHAPERLKCVTVVCGIGPPDIGMAGAGWFHWLGFTYGWRYAPRLAAWFFKSQEQLDLPDEKRLDIRLQQAKKQDAQFTESEKDIWTNKDIVGRMVMSSRQVYLQGIDGFGQDGYLLCTEFGFDIQDIRHDLPINLWYGKYDTFVPPNHGRQIAKRLGDHVRLRLEHDTHASIFFRWRKEILEDLVSNI